MQNSNETNAYLKSIQMFPRKIPNLFYLKIGNDPDKLVENFTKRLKSALSVNSYPRIKNVESLVAMLFSYYIPKKASDKHFKELNVGKILADIRNYLMYADTVRCDIEEMVHEIKIEGIKDLSKPVMNFVKVFDDNQTELGWLLPFGMWCKLCVGFIDMQYGEANCYLSLCKSSEVGSDFVANLESNVSKFRDIFYERFDSSRR